ncbi:MAG: CDP-alcohol phosphatidyltransferase family protein [Candidatus Aminicenantes bacterium]|nr:CDP-alcohol phosphatidyltransferase family protein [Candidatus Aminicenantes bacterium]
MSVLAGYKKSLKRLEVEELPDLFLFRPLAFVLVKGIYRTNITPNQITMVSLLVGILAGVSFGFGRRSTILLGGLLYGFSIVLDCADGQLARLKKNGTRLGRILDGLIDYIVSVAVYLGIGIGLGPASDHPGMWWVLLAATGTSHVFHSISIDHYRIRFLDRVEGSSGSVEEDDYRAFKAELDSLNAGHGQVLRKTVIGLYLRYLNIQKSITSRAAGAVRGKRAEADAFYARNKAAMRGWTLLGPSMGGLLLIVAALLGRFDLYFWGRIVVMNIWAAVMYIVQFRIDHSLADETEAEDGSA